jgi:alpha-ketoglutarate-dependent taurine dioxygenase
MATIEIEPIKPFIGGIVHVDRAALLDKAAVRRYREALEERGVLVFPRLGLSDVEQLEFTDALGTRVHYAREIPGGRDTDVYKITLNPDMNDQPEHVEVTYFWHVDGVTMDMPLPKATVLTARTVAAKGGQTEFCNAYVAYEQLPEEEQRELDGLTVVHNVAASYRVLFGTQAEWERIRGPEGPPLMERPLVWTHSSGRKSLLIGSHADMIVGMPVSHGRALLTRLLQWASQPQFCYRHHWQQGDLIVWDNYGTLHRVVPYARESGRTMHRTTVQGDERAGRVLQA